MTPDKFVRKHQWGSSNPNYPNPGSHPIGATQGVTLHWEGPGVGNFPHSRCARKVRAIERFHTSTRGWAGIAYNALVCPHGWVFEGRGVHTKPAANGNSHSNDTHYAVCYLGGKGDSFTAKAKRGFRQAVRWLRSVGDAGREVNGHRDHKATACPGDAIYRWLHATDFDKQVKEADPMSDWHNTRITNFKSQGGKTRRYWDWFMRLVNMTGRIQAWVKPNRNNHKRLARIEAQIDDLPQTVDDAVQDALLDATVQVDVNVSDGRNA